MSEAAEHGIAELLIGAAEATKAAFDEAVGARGMTASQARALFALRSPCRMSALADQLSCDASNITAIADRLEALGLLDRVTGKDRRVKLLTLTDEGERMTAELSRAVARQSFPVDRLGERDQAELRRLLTTMLGDN